MKFPDAINAILGHGHDEKTLWEGRYKIPWDDPEFSRRMLMEHLSQDHDLASRKTDMIKKQVAWIHEHQNNSAPGRLLDIGCGPGLYVEQFVNLGYVCTGIDFSPASIEYAEQHLGGRAVFIKGDIRAVDFPDRFDTAMMLYGELNVFSPDECRNILKKAHDALIRNGRLLLEVHTYDAIRRIAETPYSWYKSGPGLQGLFSDRPHICLVENHWLENQQTALQIFHILDDDGNLETYRSTNKAWTDDQYRQLMSGAGFADVVIHDDWPVPGEDFQLVSGVR